jgi:hypothetical protein
MIATSGQQRGMHENQLPAGFQALQPLVAEWAQPDERARTTKRVSTPVAALREFQGAVFPHLENILDYLNTLPNDPAALAPPDRTLFRLVQMVMEASAPLDLKWDSPDIEDVFPISRMRFHPPSI